MHGLSAQLRTAPPALADRIEALLAAPPREAFVLLHALEGEVLELVAAALPEVELGALRQRRAAFVPA